MDLTQLANLGEFIGGVAVLITLVYLAFQVWQGNHVERSDSYRAFIATWNQDVWGPLSDPVQGPLLRRANSDFETLSGDDKLAAFGYWAPITSLAVQLFETRGRKVSADNQLWEASAGFLAALLQMPGPSV
jgi:hypothetical protein